MDAGTSQLKANVANLDLGLLEIEILLYLLNGRKGLGPYADSAKAKLSKARKTLLPPEETEPATTSIDGIDAAEKE
jgi:hypothetical protein